MPVASTLLWPRPHCSPCSSCREPILWSLQAFLPQCPSFCTELRLLPLKPRAPQLRHTLAHAASAPFPPGSPRDSPPLSSGVLWHLGVAHCLFFLCKVGFCICRAAPACVRGRCSAAEMLGVCSPAEVLGVCLHSAPPSMKSVTSCPPRPSTPRAAPWCRRPTHCWESGR